MTENRLNQSPDGTLEELRWDDVKVRIERVGDRTHRILIAGENAGFVLYAGRLQLDAGFDHGALFSGKPLSPDNRPEES